MTISLDHVELTTHPSVISDEKTHLRYWQAQVPGTDLYAVTEEGFTHTGFETHQRLTRFFVCTRPASEHGPAGNYLVQGDALESGHGRAYDACQALTEPHTWDDAPRQQLLAEALDHMGSTQVEA